MPQSVRISEDFYMSPFTNEKLWHAAAMIVIVFIIEINGFFPVLVCVPIATCAIVVWPLKGCSNHFLTFIRIVLNWISLTFHRKCCNSDDHSHHPHTALFRLFFAAVFLYLKISISFLRFGNLWSTTIPSNYFIVNLTAFQQKSHQTQRK